MDEYVINLENVSKIYRLYNDKKDRLKEALHPFRKQYHDDFYAIKDLNLKVKKGEILGIVGKNGAGKSTLLELIAGILTPTGGKVTTKGHVVPLLELGAGFNPEFTGIENIYFYCATIGYSRKQTDAILKDIVQFADIGEFMNQPVKTYSSGMKARLGFAVSVNVNPDILILDEILSVGDELFRRKSFARMEEFFRAQKTILYVSHALNSVNELCTRAIFLDEGQLILEGSPKLVTMYYQKYIFTPRTEQPRLKQQILAMNRSENIRTAESDIAINEENLSFDEALSTMKDEKKSAVADGKLKAYHIPGFKPTSTVITRNFPVDVIDSGFMTPEGKQVSALCLDEEYVYSYKVRFDLDATQIVTGVPFKTEKGLVLTHSHIRNNPLPVVRKGEIFKFDWHFRCQLLPGIYFTNIGVTGIINGNQELLYRIVDADVFKVIAAGKSDYGGFFSLGQRVEVSRVG